VGSVRFGCEHVFDVPRSDAAMSEVRWTQTADRIPPLASRLSVVVQALPAWLCRGSLPTKQRPPPVAQQASADRVPCLVHEPEAREAVCWLRAHLSSGGDALAPSPRYRKERELGRSFKTWQSQTGVGGDREVRTRMRELSRGAHVCHRGGSRLQGERSHL